MIDELVYHRECYQKFTYTKTLLKRKSQENLATPRLSKRVRMTPESKTSVTKKQLFPSCCYFCKKNRITVNKSEEKPTNILTNETQESCHVKK